MVPELLFPVLGLLLVVLGWPMAARRVRPNRWYGLRVPATFADEQVWYDANAVAGRESAPAFWGWGPWSWPCAAGGSRTDCCARGVGSPARPDGW
jgi:hypothetical protein